MSYLQDRLFIGSSSEYKAISKIKNGGMSNVWNGLDIGNDKNVAIKIVLDLATDSSHLKDQILKEAEAILVLKHKNICKLYDVCRCENSQYRGLVVEHVDGLDLQDYIQYKRNIKESIDLGYIYKIIYQVADALDYAHSLSFKSKSKEYVCVLHRDIKPSNIVLGKNSDIKLIDFGTSSFQSNELDLSSAAFTKNYTSPDLWKGDKYDFEGYDSQNDLYSLGLVFYELITLRKAFPIEGQEKQGDINYDLISKFIDAQTLAFFKKWTHPEKDKRIKSAKEIKDFFNLYVEKFFKLESMDIEKAISFDSTSLDHTVIDTFINRDLSVKNTFVSYVDMYGLLLMHNLSLYFKMTKTERRDFQLSLLKNFIEEHNLGINLEVLEEKPIHEQLYDVLAVYCQIDEIANKPYEDFDLLLRNTGELLIQADSNLEFNEKYSLVKGIIHKVKDLELDFIFCRRFIHSAFTTFSLKPRDFLYYNLFLSPHGLISDYNEPIFQYTKEKIFNPEVNQALSKEHFIQNFSPLSLVESKRLFDLMSRRKKPFLKKMSTEKINSIAFFLYSIANIDGDFSVKERELISQLTKSFADDFTIAEYNSHIYDEQTCFNTLSLEEKIFTYGLILRVACADGVLVTAEKEYLERFSAKLIGEKISLSGQLILFNTFLACSRRLIENIEFTRNEFIKFNLYFCEEFIHHFYLANTLRQVLFGRGLSKKAISVFIDEVFPEKVEDYLDMNLIYENQFNSFHNIIYSLFVYEAISLKEYKAYLNEFNEIRNKSLSSEKLIVGPDINLLVLIGYKLLMKQGDQSKVRDKNKEVLEKFVDKFKISIEDIRDAENILSILFKMRVSLVMPRQLLV